MDKILSSRLDEAVVDELERVSRQLGMTKKQFLEEAIRLRAQEAREQQGGDIWEETLGAWKRDEPPADTVRAVRKHFRDAFERHHRK
jgi:hypothetical protein